MIPMVPNLSLVPMPAREVHRLALISIADIERMRAQAVEAALKEVSAEMCSHFFGLYKHRLYPSRELALKHAPEVQQAKQFARTDMGTCELLKRAAQHLLEDDTLTDEQRVMYITLNDFRALT